MMQKAGEVTATLTSGEVSRLAGIPLQTLISWDRAGALTAKRASPRSPRRYDEDGLLAALFAQHLSAMGFKGNTLAGLVRLMQSADRQKLRRWQIYSYRRSAGLVGHDCTEGVTARRHLKLLRERGQLLDEPTDLWTVREGLLESARTLMERRHQILGAWEER